MQESYPPVHTEQPAILHNLHDMQHSGIRKRSVRKGIHVLKFRCALETEMLRQNYTMITQECITKLARVNSQKHIYNNKYDSTTRWEDNTDFHLTLMSFYNNSYANDVMAQSMRLLHRAYAQYFWDTSRDSSPSISTWRHELVIESLKSKDLDGACKALAEDILGFDNLSLYIV